MSNDFNTTQDDIVQFRRTINSIRSRIDDDCHSFSTDNEMFRHLESQLSDVVDHLDHMYDELKVHVYAFDVTVTATRRVYVKGSDECEAEEAAIEYAEQCIDLDGEWSMQDTVVFRDEDEETTSVYDVEV